MCLLSLFKEPFASTEGIMREKREIQVGKNLLIEVPLYFENISKRKSDRCMHLTEKKQK